MTNKLRDYFKLLKTHPYLSKNDNALFKLILSENMIVDWIKEYKSQTSQDVNIGIVYKDDYILVLRDLVKFSSGKLGPYFRVINTADLVGGQGVAVLPIFKNKAVILFQFRHATRNWHYEIPRGFGEPNVNAEENAKKEIFEEIGGNLSRLIDLGPFNTNTGLEGTTTQLFLGYLDSISNINIDEGIESHIVIEFKILEKMIANSEITDSFTIASYTRAKLNGFL